MAFFNFLLKSLTLTFIVFSLHFLPSFPYTPFVFGDSLVDAGNNDYIFTLSKADSPPYGIDFTASGGRPTGRFTNGRTTTDILGQALGEKSFPPPYLSPNTRVSDGIFRGVNYASGASGILDETGYLFLLILEQIGRVPLRKQIDYFEESRDYMVKMMEESGATQLLRRAIFSITIGSNDFLDYFEPSIPFIGSGKMSPMTLQDEMVSNLTLQLKRLHKLGARKFIVVGVGPLGCIPFVRALMLVRNGECSSIANKLIQGYNKKLSKMLDQLNEELGPETIFIYANSYDIVAGIIRNYRKYGFENAYDPCCGGNFPPFICFKGHNKNESSDLCKDRSKYVFWDAYHPTEAANIIIAGKLLDGDETVASPINLRQLYSYRS
ncbi:GDSL esterase/lipase At5g41890 [Magnolia sinica]|uniref:GDSL esterase/lipase At5g41890 n=1 Tax=Magnolia sinica TaxID=86752 RepID=UPI002657F616|nr:GDSL esterase/lipase At5g41890 [Magnolia sinica]